MAAASVPKFTVPAFIHFYEIRKNHSEPNRPSADKPQFAGSVEIIPPRPPFIEFITAKHLWGIPLRQLEHFILGDNPESRRQKNFADRFARF